MPTWNPDLYLRFADERTRPARDLAARVPRESPRRVVDLGCGPGNSTAVLRQRWPAAEVVGVDISDEMIAAATAAAPRERWQQADLATWTADVPYDVVFANASLQWVPDHERLMPRLLEQVAPGGVLAVQIPAHVDSAVHRRILEISRDPRWIAQDSRSGIRQDSEDTASTAHRQKSDDFCYDAAARLDAARSALTMHRPGFYYDLLRPHVERLDLWETEYQHVLDGPDSIVEWIRGTGLRPFLEALETEADRAEFLERLRSLVRQDYPLQRDGRVLFPFRRLFMIAERTAP